MVAASSYTRRARGVSPISGCALAVHSRGGCAVPERVWCALSSGWSRKNDAGVRRVRAYSTAVCVGLLGCVLFDQRGRSTVSRSFNSERFSRCPSPTLSQHLHRGVDRNDGRPLRNRPLHVRLLLLGGRPLPVLVSFPHSVTP